MILALFPEDKSGGMGTPPMLSKGGPRRSKLPVRERQGEEEDINESLSGLMGVRFLKLLLMLLLLLLLLPTLSGMGGALSETRLAPLAALLAKSREDNSRALPIFSPLSRSMRRRSSVLNSISH